MPAPAEAGISLTFHLGLWEKSCAFWAKIGLTRGRSEQALRKGLVLNV